jgi:hypothetical protein
LFGVVALVLRLIQQQEHPEAFHAQRVVGIPVEDRFNQCVNDLGFVAVGRRPIAPERLLDEVREGRIGSSGATSFRTAPSGVVSMMPESWQSSRSMAYLRLSFCRLRRAFDVG